MIDRIYHYTDIKTLGLILKNRTIRFKRFDLMDDRTETDGLPEMLKKNYFLSCWVSDVKEKIPQWAMYAPKGVRIELPRKWYKKFPIPIAGTDQYLAEMPIDENHPAKNTFFPTPFADWFKNNQKYYFAPPVNEESSFVVKVEYATDFIDQKKRHWIENEDGAGILLSHIDAPVKYKDAYWDFQDEIRFFLFANCINENRNDLPEYIDLPIDDSALKKIKIRLYPNCLAKDKYAVQELIADNFPTLDGSALLESSLLDGKYFPKNINADWNF